jgi:hypothetical protein
VIPVVATMVDAGSIPVLEIGPKATHPRELGISDRVIAWTFGVNDKTVAGAISSSGLKAATATSSGSQIAIPAPHAGRRALRETIERSRLLRLAKAAANAGLSGFGAGDTLKVCFRLAATPGQTVRR